MPLFMHIQSDGAWDEAQNMFTDIIDVYVKMEHSLVAIQEWEAKYHRPFLDRTKKLTRDESEYYYYCMSVQYGDWDQNLFHLLTDKQRTEVNGYIENSRTATTIKEDQNKKKSREIQTAEVIYNMMLDLEIPYECRTWHLNQLFTLLQVRAIKSQPGKKMSKKDQAAQRMALNNARKAKHHSRG